MKKLLLIVIVSSSLAACKKNGVPPPVNLDIVGKWELHERTGGNIIPQDTIYKAGNGNIFQFNSNNTYQLYINGTLSQHGTYHLQNYSGYNMQAIKYEELYFDNNTNYSYLISFSENMLRMEPTMPDIGTTDYEKLQN